MFVTVFGSSPRKTYVHALLHDSAAFPFLGLVPLRAMAVSAEILQAMMMDLQKQNKKNLAILMKQIQGGGPGGGMIDSRGIGRPIVFKGEESKYAEWKAKLLAYLRVTNPKSVRWVQWGSKETGPVMDEDVDLEYGSRVRRSRILP